MTRDSQGAGFVLVVDDDWMTREIVEAHLARAGFRVAQASGGAQALALAEADPPDVILLDVRMGDMDGYEVCRQLKDNARTRRIPVVTITALDEDAQRQQALQAGADDFLAKPINPLIMLARVRSLVRIARLSRALSGQQQALAAVLSHHVDPATAAAILAEWQAALDDSAP